MRIQDVPCCCEDCKEFLTVGELKIVEYGANAGEMTCPYCNAIVEVIVHPTDYSDT